MSFYRTYIRSYDTVLAVIVVALLWGALPRLVSSAFAKDVYSVGISVLSIIFAVFFAALAIIITSSDDKFVQWLEQKGHYRDIIGLFKLTLTALFVALLASLVLYVCTSQYIQSVGEKAQQSRWWLIAFSGLFTYSLIATGQAVSGAIAYAERRATFMSLCGTGDASEPNQAVDGDANG